MAQFKYMKRSNIYKASNVSFNPSTMEAYSYDWWKFVTVIEGKTVFNNYKYSVTTARHQWNVRRLMETLGISIDLMVRTNMSLSKFSSLEEIENAHNEQLVLEDLDNERKRIERNAKARMRAAVKRKAEGVKRLFKQDV